MARAYPLPVRPVAAHRPPLLACALALLLVAARASAQEVTWRHDYNAARREAVDKGRPLVLDFITANCFWCSKLEATTFRDSAVAKVINDRFVPLKVDAQQNPQLTEALRIQSFPTLVLAAPDGKILGTLEGYLEAAKLTAHLQHALAAVNNPDWMNRDYQDAVKAASTSDYARAVALLKGMLEDGQERPVQAKAKHLFEDLEQQAANRLARARQLQDRGQSLEAADTLTELLRAFPGTQAATEGGELLSALAVKPEIKSQQRTRRARELLGQARQDYRTQQYLCCIDHCEVLASSYADLPEGAEAMQLVAEIKNNPEWMRQACDSLSDRLGLLYLCLAETWLRKGQPQQAEVCLERVLRAFPGSHQAGVAEARLAQIHGQPTRQADFKKP